MNYVNPKMVRSPKNRISGLKVLKDNGEDSWSLAEIMWDGNEEENKVLGIRWNGSFDEDEHSIGTPQSRGVPLWFILPMDKDFLKEIKKYS